MDFSAFDSRTAADEGRPLHLDHPVTGEKMMDGDRPCIVYVLGIEGRIAQVAAKEAAKLPKLDPEQATVGEWHDRLCMAAEGLITGFSAIDRGDRLATKEDARWFLDLQMANPSQGGAGRSFVEQVLRFSGSRAAYLGESAAASSGPHSKPDGSTHARKAKPKAAPPR